MKVKTLERGGVPHFSAVYRNENPVFIRLFGWGGMGRFSAVKRTRKLQLEMKLMDWSLSG